MEQPHSKNPESRPVSFPDWKTALSTAGLPEGRQHEYERAISTFLHRCKFLHCPASSAMAQSYQAEYAGQGECLSAPSHDGGQAGRLSLP